MDLLDDNNDVDLYNASEEMKIFSEDTKSVPQYVGKKAIVKNSLLNQGSVVLGHVEHSIISNEALIEEGAVVRDCVVMPGAIIKEGAEVYKAIIGDHEVIEKGTIINKDEKEIVLIKK